ncbi:hypothetical protein F4780DRAFT_754183 [Xylariomycetidae sp. FL0641]|nr:hypothetical protein F4780DRAFT_754183 [Xylariomycetidae sp. FL0641]
MSTTRIIIITDTSAIIGAAIATLTSVAPGYAIHPSGTRLTIPSRSTQDYLRVPRYPLLLGQLGYLAALNGLGEMGGIEPRCEA